ncbi:calpain-5-like [Hydractinia symbiolongicarpus]|uniref:calpain-5-like n=1 Tax=Hydractinia symbiolongicarpus TaxID=13093 RepID=UPI00254FC6C3|nr:calpain-5-like [Hydractinia symbiolongicarpus]XP_057301623.1 calpain-5-like [Hydractinia symbiolongicarpus]
MVYKNFKNQDFKSLRAECVTNGRLFEDPEFPATNSSLYFSKQPPFTAEWKRPKEISPDASMFTEGASSADVTQGRVGNCWFVAAAASLALEKDLWTKVIPNYKSQLISPEKPEDYQGIFRFRFWRFGEWIEVVVDDRLPTVNGELIYLKSKDKNEFWSALLEKAYAKLAGSYEALEAGNPADALVDFTGGVSETIDLVKGNYINDLEKRKLLHQKLVKLMERNALSSASIKVTSRDEMEKQLDTGLIKGHAYGISAVKKIPLSEGFFSSFNAEKLFLVKLRNPWGEKEWNGPWSDGSAEWGKLSKKEREKLGIKNENDGEFWMSFEDFCRHFTTVTICMLVNTSVFTIHKTYNEGALKGVWEGRSAGGCVNNKDTFLHNPQFKFDMTGSKKDIAFVSLMQPDTRAQKAAGQQGNLTIGFFIMRVEANRSYRVHQQYDKAGDSSFVNSREVFVRLELDPGRYIIVPSTFDSNISGEFLLRVYTDHSNHMRELKEEQPTAGCFSWAPCCKHPQAQVSIIVTSVNNLKKKGSVSMTVDPYCIIEIEGTKVRTPHKTDNVNPTFDYGGLFYVKKPESSMIKIQVWDQNTLVPDTFLGEITHPIDCNNRILLQTHSLVEKKSRDGQTMQTDGTISFKVAASSNLEFM